MSGEPVSAETAERVMAEWIVDTRAAVVTRRRRARTAAIDVLQLTPLTAVPYHTPPGFTHVTSTHVTDHGRVHGW